ncbi:MAG: UpxY family transcription antiterminator [Prevotella sp.]|jgi:transcription antitermination factor NusG
MIFEGRNNEQWYAMSSPYRRELKAEDALVKRGFECFIPKKRTEKIDRCNQRKVTHAPVIHNLIFVHTTRLALHSAKREMNDLLQYLMKPTASGKREPVVVPEKQMDDFLRLYQEMPDELIYLSPEDITTLRENARVIIGDGVFKGIEGYLQRITGKREKCFIVKVDNVLAAACTVKCHFVKISK